MLNRDIITDFTQAMREAGGRWYFHFKSPETVQLHGDAEYPGVQRVASKLRALEGVQCDVSETSTGGADFTFTIPSETALGSLRDALVAFVPDAAPKTRENLRKNLVWSSKHYG